MDETTQIWNAHRIRPYRNMSSPSGKPFILYHTPEVVGRQDKLRAVRQQTIDACIGECTRKGLPCNRQVYELSCIIMLEHGWNPPSNTVEAKDLYLNLRQTILDGIEN